MLPLGFRLLLQQLVVYNLCWTGVKVFEWGDVIMSRLGFRCLLAGVLLVSVCQADPGARQVAPADARQSVPGQSVQADRQAVSGKSPWRTATPQQQGEIEALIDQLALNQNIDPNDMDAQEKAWDTCIAAFDKLSTYQERAFPQLVQHLDDKRPSIPFRNHRLDFQVGKACYWNIYYQLQDRPDDYSRYGYYRKGRDGKDHPQPYWKGTPFDDAGGVKKWLAAHRGLSYPEMQVKCLQWLLKKEKQIGVPDAESYFRNILPLEIQILKRRQQAGEDVQAELKRLQKIKQDKQVDQIPRELLPGEQVGR